MLVIDKVNKYFNKGRKNQLHVIDNTSLNLGDNGLVALLGPSGCGKTTLLNVIGGLDRIKKGKIYINNQKISSRNVHKVDKIRNLNVGYIFQDYKLINNMSVYDNVAIVLKMIGIKDKKEIKTRVEFVLEKVGMLRYKKRPANMLSGGEKQRVAIARAIVKDPMIILADEPTGNLDSKNSLEIMKILQAISKEKLVLLVTHEINLASFYATRIIEIRDGKVISDKENNDVVELDYQLDNTLYLKDFFSHNKISDENYSINVYSNNNEKINIDLVVSNGNIYIRSNTREKIEVVDEESSIEMINEHYKKPTKDEMDKYDFNFSNIINKNIKKRYSSIYNPITLLINGFKKIFDYSFLKKLLLVGFFLSGIFVTYAVSSIYASYQIYDKDFVKYNKNYLLLVDKELKVNDYLNIEKRNEISYILPGDSIVSFQMKYDDYYQTEYLEDSLSGSLSSLKMINNKDIIYGKNSENDYEIVVDKMILKKLLDNSINSNMIGITKEQQFLNRIVKIENLNSFKIVGIVDLNSPSIYVNENMFINILYNSNNIQDNNIYDYNLYKDKIKIKKGRIPKKDYEIIVNYDNKDSMKLNKTIKEKVNGKKLKVVGYYKSKDNYNYYFTNQNTIKYNLIKKSSDIVIYSKDKQLTLSDFNGNKYNISDSYESSKNEYLREIKKSRHSSFVTALIMLIISLIEIFLMMRSSFLSRIKEIGIYRAIGVKRIDIYKMFMGEAIAITTIGGIPGVAFASYVLYMLSNNEVLSITSFIINPFVIICSLIILYVFNLIVGLLPVFNTVRKTPASILARHDLD